MSDIFGKATDVAAGYEVVKSGIGAVVSTILAIILIAIAIYLFTRKNNMTATTTATITNSVCNSTVNAKSSQINCQLSLSYTVGGQNYTTNLNTSGTNYVKGQTIQVQYDPSNPHNVQIPSIGGKSLGIILLIIGVVILALSWGYFYLVRKNKSFAAVTGASDIVHTVL